jgi:hypothetical protein
LMWFRCFSEVLILLFPQYYWNLIFICVVSLFLRKADVVICFAVWLCNFCLRIIEFILHRCDFFVWRIESQRNRLEGHVTCSSNQVQTKIWKGLLQCGCQIERRVRADGLAEAAALLSPATTREEEEAPFWPLNTPSACTWLMMVEVL